MKNYRHLCFFGGGFPRPIRPVLWSVVASAVIATVLAGQLVTPPQGDQAVPASKEKILLEKVMTDLPTYRETSGKPVAVDAEKPASEATAETVTLVPMVILGEKRTKLNSADLRTQSAFAAEILRHYNYSGFSLFQHREDVRLEDMAVLQNYADSLMRVGDIEGSRAIKKESSRLFLRPRDPESVYIDSLLNPRVR